MLFRIIPTLIRAGLFDKEAKKELINSIWGSDIGTVEGPNQKEYKKEFVWRNILLFIYLHLSSLYGVYLLFTQAMPLTIIATVLLYIMGGLGITAGAHRLWAHRSYKAKLPLKLILVVFNTLAFQNHVIEWSRDHRVHHKHSETDADPHNATRGFFFAHMGWLLVRKHKDVKEKGKQISVEDLEKDPLLAFQKKFYVPLVLLVCFIIPSVLPMYLWGESGKVAYYTCGLLRYCWTLHMTWLVNSAAHMVGLRPYDKGISPSENKLVSWGAIGEGWHNYHHTFPYDYRASELGYEINLTSMFIDLMARIGWAYDLKTVHPETVYKRMLRTGDGSRLDNRDHVNHNGHHHHEEVPEEEIEIELVNPVKSE
jgi:stearoyl-CoA desaturase (delta-9 desaturase)